MRSNNPLDRVLLGHVAVPRDGVEREVETAVIPPATFGNHIQLIGYHTQWRLPAQRHHHHQTILASPQPNLQTTTSSLFICSTNSGELVTNHDSPPAFGTFTTRTWLADFTIADEHPLTLRPDLPSGQYKINIGLYLPKTGERLRVIDANGTDIPDRALPVDVIDIP